MLVLVVILTLVGVISPRLRNLEVDLMFRAVHRSEILRHFGFNKVPQLGQFLGF